MKQKTKPFALENWKMVGEVFKSENTISLPKSYRNTRQILTYLRDEGYEVDIPEDIKEGPDVVEKHINNNPELSDYINNIIDNENEDVIIGIVVDSLNLKEEISLEVNSDQVKVLTIIEAQGVEFETLIYVKQDDKYQDLGVLQNEYLSLSKNLDYVGITRAMIKLFVVNYSGNSG